MKPTFKTSLIAAAALAVTGALALPALAEGDKIGDTQMCIESQRIRSTSILDHKTILVSMLGRASFKRIDLIDGCTSLNKGTGFAYGTSINRLCMQDSLHVLDSGQVCMIDKIVTIDAAEAKALRTKKKN